MWCHQRQTAPPLDARTWVESPNMMAKQSFGQFVSSDQEGRRIGFRWMLLLAPHGTLRSEAQPAELNRLL